MPVVEMLRKVKRFIRSWGSMAIMNPFTGSVQSRSAIADVYAGYAADSIRLDSMPEQDAILKKKPRRKEAEQKIGGSQDERCSRRL